MTVLLLLVVLAAVAGALHMALRDERGHLAPPTSHSVDRASLPPATLLGRH